MSFTWWDGQGGDGYPFRDSLPDRASIGRHMFPDSSNKLFPESGFAIRQAVCKITNEGRLSGERGKGEERKVRCRNGYKNANLDGQ